MKPGSVICVCAMALSAAVSGSCGNRDSGSVRTQEQAGTKVITPVIDIAALSGNRALEDVRNFVQVRPRHSGSEGARKAAEYLASALRARGLDPHIDEFEELTPSGRVVFRNVTATAGPVSNGMVVMVSHYDTKSGIPGDFQGANDSGSSTGLLLELATVLTNTPGLPFGVMFAFVDGEECVKYYSASDGLHGSRRLAGILSRDGNALGVKAAIVLDMVGDRDLTVILPRNCSGHLSSLVFKAASQEGIRSKFSLADGDVIDDHVPFIAAGIPAVVIIDFAYGSKPGANDYWHTAEDTLDKLSAESLAQVGRVVIRMLGLL